MRTTKGALPGRQPGWQDLWPAVPILGTKCIFPGEIVQPRPCFIDLAPHKFTTSAFLVHRLTAERFSAGMRSDGEREAGRGKRGEGKGKSQGGMQEVGQEG